MVNLGASLSPGAGRFRMNPILLKPNSDTGAQVIVLGKPVGNMNVTEYASTTSPRRSPLPNRRWTNYGAENQVVVR